MHIYLDMIYTLSQRHARLAAFGSLLVSGGGGGGGGGLAEEAPPQFQFCFTPGDASLLHAALPTTNIPLINRRRLCTLTLAGWQSRASKPRTRHAAAATLKNNGFTEDASAAKQGCPIHKCRPKNKKELRRSVRGRKRAVLARVVDGGVNVKRLSC